MTARIGRNFGRFVGSATAGALAVPSTVATEVGFALRSAEASQTGLASVAGDASDSSGQTIEIKIPQQESWDQRDKKRFRDLAVRRAKGISTAEEDIEFEELQKVRRLLESPLSADQILAEFRHREMLRDLCRFFEKYGISR